jgi:hypothetical protein
MHSHFSNKSLHTSYHWRVKEFVSNTGIEEELVLLMLHPSEFVDWCEIAESFIGEVKEMIEYNEENN